MKLYLLSGSALIASMSMALANPVSTSYDSKLMPTLTISGSATAHVSGTKQEVKSGQTQGYNFAVEDAMLNFAAEGKTDNGLEYLMRLTFSGQPGVTTPDTNYSAHNRVRQAYVQLSGWGFTVQGGAVDSADAVKMVDGSLVMGGDGGFVSDWSNRFNVTNDTIFSSFLVANPGYANKMNIYTPRVGGFQIGLSWTPNTRHLGDEFFKDNRGKSILGGSVDGPYAPFDQNVFSGALSYNNHFGDLTLSMAVVGVHANTSKTGGTSTTEAEKKLLNKSRGWAAGAVIGWKGFELGGGYSNNQKTGEYLVDSVNGSDGGRVWNVAVGYQLGHYKLAVGYLSGQKKFVHSEGQVGKTKSKIVSVTADWFLADGLSAYVDYNHVDMKHPVLKTKDTLGHKNNGSVVLLGTRVSF